MRRDRPASAYSTPPANPDPADGVVTVDFFPEELEAIQRCADELGVTVNDLVAAAVTYQIPKIQTLACCPFCRKRDELEFLSWACERPDGSEYNGPAVRCNRCTAIAPLSAWLSLQTPKLQPVKHG